MATEGLTGLGAATFDPARAEGAGSSDTARHLRTALLLGWKVEANWTDPTLFVIYSVVKPIASLLLIYAMVAIVGGATDESAKTFVILGSSLWAMLVAGITGPAWTILEERGRRIQRQVRLGLLRRAVRPTDDRRTDQGDRLAVSRLGGPRGLPSGQ